jgi:hypothetical protein
MENEKETKGKSSNIWLYLGIAIVVVVAVFAVASTFNSSNGGNQAYNVSLALSPYGQQSTLYPFQTSYLLLTITNNGKNYVKGMVVGIYINGSQETTYDVNMTPQSNKTVLLPHFYTVSGEYQISAIADPGHVLNIPNRSAAQGSVLVDVAAPEAPDVFTSAPNSNITYTQTFSLLQEGLATALFASQYYNVSIFNQMTDLHSVVFKLLATFSPYINAVNGADINYANSTNAYVLWMQGSVMPVHVMQEVSSMGLHTSNVTLNGTNVVFVKVSNNTSMCTYYQLGWTKLIYLTTPNSTASNSQATNSTTCLSIAARSYQPTEGNAILTALKSDKALSKYQTKFQYLNSSDVGSSLTYENGSIAALGISQNQYGFFSGYIKQNVPPLATNALNLTCIGLIYSSNSESVCTKYVLPTNSTATRNYAFLNTTEIGSDYNISLYSLVNSSYLQGAHYSAAQLIGYVNASQSFASWSTKFKSSCTSFNASFGCGLLSFNYNGNIAHLNITNKLGTQMTINRIGCFTPGSIYVNTTLDSRLAPGQSSNLTINCYSITMSSFSIMSNYNLLVNFTTSSGTHIGVGELNITNFQSG